MNNAGYQQFKNWQKSRNGAAFLQNNDAFRLSKSNLSSKNINENPLTLKNDEKNKKQNPATKSRYFKSKFSKSTSEKQINFQKISPIV